MKNYGFDRDRYVKRLLRQRDALISLVNAVMIDERTSCEVKRDCHEMIDLIARENIDGKIESIIERVEKVAS